MAVLTSQLKTCFLLQDNMTDEQIMGINLPTGIPFVYELDEDLKPVVSMQVMLESNFASRRQLCLNRDDVFKNLRQRNP